MSLPVIAKIDTNLLKENANLVKNKIGSAKLCAVVKADAYGHGLVEIASSLYDIVDYYAVALTSECYTLRISGIDKPILLLTPCYEDIERLIENDITLSVSSLEEIKQIRASAKNINKIAKIQFKINSGMNRLGFDSISQIISGLEYAKNHSKHLKITGAFSHLCKPENKELSNKQLYAFLYLAKPIKEYDNSILLHIASSGGIFNGNEYLLDMVRVGLLLYGYTPCDSVKLKVTPIMKVYAKVIAKRKGLKGCNLLYGDEVYSKDTAYILRVGYADGFFRLGIDNSVTNLCMDLCATNKVTSSDYTLIMSDAKKLAKKYKTITYEVLVNISKRAIREYLK